MKLKIKLLNLIFLLTAVALLSVSFTAMITGLATPEWVESWRYSEFEAGGYWSSPQFPEAWPMFGVGIGLLIGAVIGMTSSKKRRNRGKT